MCADITTAGIETTITACGSSARQGKRQLGCLMLISDSEIENIMEGRSAKFCILINLPVAGKTFRFPRYQRPGDFLVICRPSTSFLKMHILNFRSILTIVALLCAHQANAVGCLTSVLYPPFLASR